MLNNAANIINSIGWYTSTPSRPWIDIITMKTTTRNAVNGPETEMITRTVTTYDEYHEDLYEPPPSPTPYQHSRPQMVPHQSAPASVAAPTLVPLPASVPAPVAAGIAFAPTLGAVTSSYKEYTPHHPDSLTPFTSNKFFVLTGGEDTCILQNW